jgi:hypothetical protein
MVSFNDLYQSLQTAQQEAILQRMNKDKRQILQTIYDCFAVKSDAHDYRIAEKLALDIYRVRVCLNELEASGIIKQITAITFNTERQHVVTEITPEGHLVLRNELPIDRTPNHKISNTINHVFNAEVGTVQSGNFNKLNREYDMEPEYQYVLEQDKKRFLVLKTIYKNSKLDKDEVTCTSDICDQTSICGEELLHILEYLESESLIKPMGTLLAMYGGSAHVTITHQGIREVEAAIKKPHESTAHFPAQVFQNTFNATVGALQQGGQNNTANVNQNIGLSDCDELVAKLSELIQSSSLPDLDKEDTIEAANRLSELSQKEQLPGVIERVKQRLELINNTLKPAQELYDKSKPLLLGLYTYFKIHQGV